MPIRIVFRWGSGPRDFNQWFRFPIEPRPTGAERLRLSSAPAPAPAPGTPVPGIPVPRTGSFPNFPAANDPRYKLRVPLPWWWARIAVDILKRVAEKQLEREQREAEEAIADREAQEAADAQSPREVSVEEFPLGDNFPEIEPDPRPALPETLPQPRPQTLPDVDPFPMIPAPFPTQVPNLPDIISIPAPGRPTIPQNLPGNFPGTVPSSNPAPVIATPGFDAFRFLGADPKLDAKPAFFPTSNPLSDAVNLTSSNVVTIRSPSTQANFGAQLAANPQLSTNTDKCPRRRCKKPKEERRTKCFKKIVFERNFKKWDRVVEWAELDCSTGREI